MKTLHHFLGLLFSIFVPTLAFAAGGPGHVPSFSDTFPFWANFIVFLTVLYFLLRRPLHRFWIHRAKDIEESVNAGARELEAAEQRLVEALSRTSSLTQDVSTLQTTMEQEADKEATRIITEAQSRAARIKEQAQDSLQAERKAVQVSVRRELADKVIEKAQARLESEIGQAEDEKLRESALKGLSGLVQ